MHPSLLPYRPDRDVYRLLGVPPTASSDEIAAAWRRLARTFHPDHNGSQRATAEMQVVNAVRAVMSDPEARATYDRERHRFHLQGLRVTEPPRPPVLEVGPSVNPPRFVAVRALLVGVRATIAALSPRRCGGCRAVLDLGDAYCPACGTRLLSGGAARAQA